ncbi:MAG: carboxymuconolactone decarboxylase family protein [Gammaproteobacteria bacterium]
MSTLNHRDRELVALGAALASNCVPCVEYHIVEARKAGLNDAEIAAAIELADRIKRVPAGKVLDAASNALPDATITRAAADVGSCSPNVAAGGRESCC